MKQLLLLTLFIPTLLLAQDDSKYLAGAVPLENGKVVFAKEINAPSFSKDEVYDRMLDWADGFFSEDGNRVVYSDKAKGDIAAVGQANLVFQSTALSLDRTEMKSTVFLRNLPLPRFSLVLSLFKQYLSVIHSSAVYFSGSRW